MIEIAGLPPSRWEKNDKNSKWQAAGDDPLSSSRWEKQSDDEETKLPEEQRPASKWEKVEGLKKGKSGKIGEAESKERLRYVQI